MRKAVVLFFVFAATALLAQEKKEEPAATTSGAEVRTFVINPASADRVFRVLNLFVAARKWDEATGTLVVKAPHEVMPAIEQAIRQNDAPQPARDMKNVELTFYILHAKREPFAEPEALPTELQSTITQLKSTFAYQGFQLYDVAILRARSGEAGALTGSYGEPNKPRTYTIDVHPSIESDGKPAALHLNRFRFNGDHIAVAGNLDFKEGQKVVIGKAGLDDGRSALILVATGRVVD